MFCQLQSSNDKTSSPEFYRFKNPHSSPTPNFQFLESLIKSWKGLISILDFRVTKIHPQIPQQIFINIYPAVSNTNNFPQQFLSNLFPVFSFSAAKRVNDFPFSIFLHLSEKIWGKKSGYLIIYWLSYSCSIYFSSMFHPFSHDLIYI